MIADSGAYLVSELCRIVRSCRRSLSRGALQKDTRAYKGATVFLALDRYPCGMSCETALFLGLIGLLSGAIGASAAEAAPYVHWMHCLRRLSQSPLTLACMHPAAALGSADRVFSFEPRTMWIRLVLAAIGALLLLVCRPRSNRRGSAPWP